MSKASSHKSGLWFNFICGVIWTLLGIYGFRKQFALWCSGKKYRKNLKPLILTKSKKRKKIAKKTTFFTLQCKQEAQHVNTLFTLSSLSNNKILSIVKGEYLFI